MSTALQEWFRAVFIDNVDGWAMVGFLGQLIFSSRFAVQWVASEKAGRSVIPIAFWFLSIGGSACLLVYAISRRDPVIILGQLFGIVVYTRNLWLIAKERQNSPAAESP